MKASNHSLEDIPMFNFKNQFYKIIVLGVVIMTCIPTVLLKSAKASTITTHQRQAIKDALKRENANAIVMVGSTKKTIIVSNQVTVGEGKAATVSTNKLFPIASFQKAITGIAIQQLINQHQLSLNTKLSKYLPEIPNSQQITVRNLLTHTSGLADRSQIAKQPLRSENESVQFTKQNYKVINQPGQWHYANVNYGLLAIIVSKVSHESYETYVKKNIFKANNLKGMKFFNQLKSPKQLNPSLTDQQFKLDPQETDSWRYLQREMSAEFGAGQILATPTSYWQFINNVVLRKKGILKEYQHIKFQANDNPYYGGFYLHPNELHANGSYDGYACTIFANTKTNQIIILFSNNITLKQCRNLGYDLYHIYFGTSRQGFPY